MWFMKHQPLMSPCTFIYSEEYAFIEANFFLLELKHD